MQTIWPVRSAAKFSFISQRFQSVHSFSHNLLNILPIVLKQAHYSIKRIFWIGSWTVDQISDLPEIQPRQIVDCSDN